MWWDIPATVLFQDKNPGRDWNRVPSKYRSEILPSEPNCSVPLFMLHSVACYVFLDKVGIWYEISYMWKFSPYRAVNTHRLNKVNDQLDATITFSDLQINPTCFGQFFAHPQELWILIYGMWYNVPRLLSVGGLQCDGSSNILHTEQSVRPHCRSPTDNGLGTLYHML